MMTRRVKHSRLVGTFAAVLSASLFACLFPPHVEAHLNSTGLGPVYDGLLHFLLSPEDVIPVIALALFAGQRGPAFGRAVLFIVPISWLCGGFAGIGRGAFGGTVITCVSLLVLGGLVAADARISLRVLAALAAIIGLVHGFLNGTGMGRPEDPALVQVGISLGVFVLIAIVSAFVLGLQRQWSRIAVRVVGSWIVASGMLLLGWAARKT